MKITPNGNLALTTPPNKDPTTSTQQVQSLYDNAVRNFMSSHVFTNLTQASGNTIIGLQDKREAAEKSIFSIKSELGRLKHLPQLTNKEINQKYKFDILFNLINGALIGSTSTLPVFFARVLSEPNSHLTSHSLVLSATSMIVSGTLIGGSALYDFYNTPTIRALKGATISLVIGAGAFLMTNNADISLTESLNFLKNLIVAGGVLGSIAVGAVSTFPHLKSEYARRDFNVAKQDKIPQLEIEQNTLQDQLKQIKDSRSKINQLSTAKKVLATNPEFFSNFLERDIKGVTHSAFEDRKNAHTEFIQTILLYEFATDIWASIVNKTSFQNLAGRTEIPPELVSARENAAKFETSAYRVLQTIKRIQSDVQNLITTQPDNQQERMNDLIKETIQVLEDFEQILQNDTMNDAGENRTHT